LNEQIVFTKIGTIDPGASTTVHVYGAYYGLAACLVLSKVARPITDVKISYISNIFAFIGTLFLVIYFPSFNYVVGAQNAFEQNLIVVNTVLSLTGGVLGTFIVSALGMGRGLEMENILNATIVGGIIIGAPCGFIYRPGVSIFIGFTGGIISTLCFHYLGPKLLTCIGLYDTCGINSLHGIPSVLAGLWSAVIIAFYNTGFDANIAAMYANGNFMVPTDRSFIVQARLQVAGTFCSFGMGIAFGIVGGLVTSFFYKEKNKFFYLDTEYFDNANFREFYRDDKGQNLYLKQKDYTYAKETGQNM
jgi:ammonium transporter Rh